MKKNYLLLVAVFAMSSFMYGQGFETFTNLPLGSNYETGNFVGDNGITWNYEECKDENDDQFSSGINLPAIMLNKESNGGKISVNSGLNGVGEITMKLYKGLSDTINRQVDIYVNEILYGTSPGFNDNAEHIYKISGINVIGNVLIEIHNTKSAQIIVDDVQWSASGVSLSVIKNNIKGFAMYPNPVTNGEVRLTSQRNAIKQVEIYSMLGKQVFNKTVNPNETINVSNLNTGMYMMRVVEEGKIATRKLVIR